MPCVSALASTAMGETDPVAVVLACVSPEEVVLDCQVSVVPISGEFLYDGVYYHDGIRVYV